MVEDIFWRTAGHAGLVCFCGTKVAVAAASGRLSAVQWQRMATFGLPRAVSGHDNCSSMFHDFTHRAPAVQRVVALLFNTLLFVDWAPAPNTDDAKACGYLAAAGAVVQRGDAFTVSSPLMRTILYSTVHSFLGGLPTPPYSMPFNPARADTLGTLLGALEHLDRAAIRRAGAASPNLTRRSVPSEAVYHHALATLLRAWATAQVDVLSEVRAGGLHRCDIVLRLVDDRRPPVALELAASASPGDLRAHLQHLQGYADALGAAEGWLVHFTQSPPALRAGDGEGRLHWPAAAGEFEAVCVASVLADAAAAAVSEEAPAAAVREVAAGAPLGAAAATAAAGGATSAVLQVLHVCHDEAVGHLHVAWRAGARYAVRRFE